MRRVTVLSVALLCLMAAPSTSTVAGNSKYPAMVVAVTARGHVVVLEAGDGRRIRTLSAHASRYGGLAVRDRIVWYLSRGRRSVTTCGHGAPPDQHVMAVPLSGGTPRRVLDVPVRWFDVSPDGRMLAVTEGRCPPAGTITTYDLATRRGGGQVGRSATARHERRDHLAELVTRLAVTPVHPRDRIHLPLGPRHDDRDVAGRRSTRSSRRRQQRRGLPRGERVDARRVPDRWWLAPGMDVRRHDGRPAAPALLCCGTPLSSDASGTAVLAWSGAGDLACWSSGETAPTRIAHRVTQAVWVKPAPRRDAPRVQLIRVPILRVLHRMRRRTRAFGGLIRSGTSASRPPRSPPRPPSPGRARRGGTRSTPAATERARRRGRRPPTARLRPGTTAR